VISKSALLRPPTAAPTGPGSASRAEQLLAVCRTYFASRDEPDPTEDTAGGLLLLLLRALDEDFRAVRGDGTAMEKKHAR